MVCNSGIRFDPIVNNKALAFDFYGLYNGVVTMIDRSTKSVWLQVGGRAIKGSLLNTTLKTAPLTDTTWKRWKELHPDTLVMSPDTPFRECYDPKGVPVPRGYSEFPSPYFQRSMVRRDKRLPAFEMVLAVTVSTENESQQQAVPSLEAKRHYRAYPIKTLQNTSGVFNDVLGTQPLSIFFEADSQTATAFSRMLDGQMLTFETRKQAGKRPLIYDKETGSRWTIEGKAVEGSWMGRELTRMDSYMSEWYGWASYFPQTSIMGQGDALRSASAGKPAPQPTKQNEPLRVTGM